jgi:hypothetical protein
MPKEVGVVINDIHINGRSSTDNLEPQLKKNGKNKI